MILESECCILCGETRTVSLLYQPSAHYYDSSALYKYFYCNVCGVLWLDRKSIIYNEQYVQSYYSFSFKNDVFDRVRFLAKQIIYNLWYCFKIDFPYFDGYILDRVFKKLLIDKRACILDVGCGSGRFVYQLYAYGYKNVFGVDPYAHAHNIGFPSIQRALIEEVKGQFDVINAHHVIEHVDDPRSFIAELHRLLRPGGIAIITFPRLSGVIEYDGEYSYLLQAPDHKTLFTAQCFKRLSAECKFEVVYEEYDGSGTFNWLLVGELWRRGINVQAYSPSLLKLLTKDEIDHIKLTSERLNVSEAANSLFILKK